jgi:hypothetical protein
LRKSLSRHYYRIKTSGGGERVPTPYSGTEIDFLVAYIFPEDAWYIFPATIFANRKMLLLVPGSKRSRFEQYREAWNLMKPVFPDPHTNARADGIPAATGDVAPT